MVRQARILAQATSDLVNAIKMDAEGESDLENSRKLLSAAKLLADATAKMVEAAKVGTFFVSRGIFIFFYLVWSGVSDALFCKLTLSPQGAAANPDSEEQQQKLREAAEGLRMATNAAAQNAIKKRLVNKLEVNSRQTDLDNRFRLMCLRCTPNLSLDPSRRTSVLYWKSTLPVT